MRLIEVESAAPAGTRMIVELGGGVRMVLADREAVELAAQLIEHLRSPRRQGGRP